mgnify:FL=1
MAKLLKLRRGTTTQHGSFTGAEGEVTIDTDKDTAVVHDGSTTGGRALAREDLNNVSSSTIAGRLSNDSIAVSKIAAGTLPSDVKIQDANVSGNLTIESADIVNGTIVNADINASAAIDGTKISPNFGSQNITTTGVLNCDNINASDNLTITSVAPKIFLNDSDTNDDFSINGDGGSFRIKSETDAANRFIVNSDGHVDIPGNLDCGAGVDVTGNITVTGTVDGRDVASDGGKLDGIEANATADQTAAEIRTLVESASDSNVFTDADHTKLNGIETAATADQTAAEIRTLVESASDSNVFTDADHSKLNGIESGATGDQSNAEIRAAVAAASDSNVFTDADHAKLDALTTSNGVILNGVTATTQSAGDASTKVATTAYTDTAISNLVDSSPSALNTLNELAAALGDDANFSTTVTNSIATKMPLAGGEFTGNVTCENITPDADSSRNLGTNSVRFATIYADSFVGSGANLTGVESFVSGMILLWSGSTGSIPSGFVLCNGSNSTPDLRDRFVVGAGNSYAVGNTGGNNTATDTVNISGSDTVNVSVSGSGTTGNEFGNFGSTNLYGYNGTGIQYRNMNNYYWGTTTHAHGFNFSGSGSDTVNISGSDTVSIDTRSPYYALCYIMKT